MKENGVIQEYTGSLSRQIREEYYHGEIKRGLRNSDGTGVMVGVTKVGSVQGYLLQDGQRIPIPGRLYYRGIELNDIVEAHRAEGTFGFEEVAYLLLMGYLPSQGELRHFNEIMNRARKLPEGFTEGMIMRRTSGNIMNELGRSILSLYSYDPDPDDAAPVGGAHRVFSLHRGQCLRRQAPPFRRRVPAHPLPGGGTQHGGELPADDPSG